MWINATSVISGLILRSAGYTGSGYKLFQMCLGHTHAHTYTHRTCVQFYLKSIFETFKWYCFGFRPDHYFQYFALMHVIYSQTLTLTVISVLSSHLLFKLRFSKSKMFT